MKNLMKKREKKKTHKNSKSASKAADWVSVGIECNIKCFLMFSVFWSKSFESGRSYAKWYKPDTQRQIPDDLTFM